MLTLEYNKNLPVFPKYVMTKVENTILFESSVHVHVDIGSHVEIYKYPIREWYGLPTNIPLKEVKKNFKRTCLRYHKYLDPNDKNNRKTFVYIDTVSKLDENFEELIYYTYL